MVAAAAPALHADALAASPRRNAGAAPCPAPRGRAAPCPAPRGRAAPCRGAPDAAAVVHAIRAVSAAAPHAAAAASQDQVPGPRPIRLLPRVQRAGGGRACGGQIPLVRRERISCRPRAAGWSSSGVPRACGMQGGPHSPDDARAACDARRAQRCAGRDRRNLQLGLREEHDGPAPSRLARVGPVRPRAPAGLPALPHEEPELVPRATAAQHQPVLRHRLCRWSRRAALGRRPDAPGQEQRLRTSSERAVQSDDAQLRRAAARVWQRRGRRVDESDLRRHLLWEPELRRERHAVAVRRANRMDAGEHRGG